MPLTCECSEPIGGWRYFCESAEDLEKLNTARGRRCKSCGVLIKPGMDCLKFIRYRPARDDYELLRFGDDYDAVKLAPGYHCEKCAGLYWALEELGFCVNYSDDMMELVPEYNGL